MKKILNCLFLMIMIFPIVVFGAGSASGSVPSSIEIGKTATFTVTVSNTASWNLKLSGSGATSGCSQAYADATDNAGNTTKKFTVTCKGTSVGTITFTAKGDITSADGTNSNVSITKTVNVTKAREKEIESRLSSLSIDGYKISFDKDKTNYSISVDPSVTSINISAKAMSSRASISGAGKKNIDGDEKFQVVCTAENGTKKTYTINVSIVDSNPINVNIDGVDYTVVKSTKQLSTPLNSNSSTTEINKIKIPSFTNEKANIIIIGIKDKDGNIKYAIYNNGTYELYNENKSSELSLYISSKALDDYDETKITINDKEYTAYYLDDRFKLVYAMNLLTGEYNYYKYDTTDNTFQYFDTNTIDNCGNSLINIKDDSNIFLITTVIFAVISILTSGYIFKSKLKKNKQQI